MVRSNHDNTPLSRRGRAQPPRLVDQLSGLSRNVTTGNTFAALMTHAPDALASVIEAMQEDGAKIPGSFNGSPRSFIAADYQNPHIVLVPVQVGGNLMP